MFVCSTSSKHVYTSSIYSLIRMLLGDLTDSRRSRFETDQYMEEWQSYHNIIKETGVANNRPWLDLPGNHGELWYIMKCMQCAQSLKMVMVTW